MSASVAKSFRDAAIAATALGLKICSNSSNSFALIASLQGSKSIYLSLKNNP